MLEMNTSPDKVNTDQQYKSTAYRKYSTMQGHVLENSGADYTIHFFNAHIHVGHETDKGLDSTVYDLNGVEEGITKPAEFIL